MNISRAFNNIPNMITLARLLMTPSAVSMIVSQRFLPAVSIFLLASVSDAVDVFIAKALRSAHGTRRLPRSLADKALLVSI
jgi:cardiolipin synthase (CMP-forming)